MPVAAARGDLITTYKCGNFGWKMQGCGFSTEFRTLSLGFSDVVLGVQWLSTLGPIIWDFPNLRIEFTFKSSKPVLRGVTPNDSKVISSSSLNKLIMQEPHIALLHLCDLDNSISPQQSLDPATIFITLKHAIQKQTKIDHYNAYLNLMHTFLMSRLLYLHTVKVSTTIFPWKQDLTLSTCIYISTPHYKKTPLTR